MAEYNTETEFYSQILDTFPKLSVIEIERFGQAKCVHLFKFLEEFVYIYLHFNGDLCINLIVYFCVRIPNVSIKRRRLIGSFRGYIIAGIEGRILQEYEFL